MIFLNVFFYSSDSNGDCLYSSVSLAIVGDNSSVEDLRALACIELFTNPSFYCKHPLFIETYERNPNMFASLHSLLQISVSNISSDSLLTHEDLVKQEAINNCACKIWSPFLCILSLSSVIGTIITSYYPDFGEEKYKILFNQEIIPRTLLRNRNAVHILFCREQAVGMNLPYSIFSPNHYVPLIAFEVQKHIAKPAGKSKSGEKWKLNFANKLPEKIQTKLQYWNPLKKNIDIKPKSSIKMLVKSDKLSAKNYSLVSFFKKNSFSEDVSSPSVSPGVVKTETVSSSSVCSIKTKNINDALSIPTSTARLKSCSVSRISSTSTSKKSLESFESDPCTNHASYPLKYDIGTYNKKQILSDEEILDLIKNVFVPDKSFSFPKRSTDSRSFRLEWLTMFPWLCYSPSMDGAFCLPCVLFGDKVQNKYRKLLRLCSKPLVNWSDAVCTFKKHDTSSVGLHADTSFIMSTVLGNSCGKSEPINVTINTAYKNKITKNKKILLSIIDSVILCGRRGWAFRGHRDSSLFHSEVGHYSSNQVGNFIELLNYRVRGGDVVLEEHMRNCAKNASYISSVTQNALIDCCGAVISKKIIDEVKRAFIS